MRLILAVLIAAAALVYFTVGVRVGVLMATPVQVFRGNGVGSYAFRAVAGLNSVAVTGECQTRSGVVYLRLIGTQGQQLASSQCPKGTWLIRLAAPGSNSDDSQDGVYHLDVEYFNYTGRLDVRQVK
jgi:hypothetical protein